MEKRDKKKFDRKIEVNEGVNSQQEWMEVFMLWKSRGVEGEFDNKRMEGGKL